jgi:hypothetical protein
MATPLINGIAHSWNNINLILFGNPVIGITSVEWDRKQEVVNNYGAGPYAVSRGFGKVEQSASIEMYYETWLGIVNAAPNKDPYLIPLFDVPITFNGGGIVPSVLVLKACSIAADPVTVAQGDTSIKVKVALTVGLIENK